MTIPVFPQLGQINCTQYESANSQSNNPFRVSPITLVYIVYAVIFGIPAPVVVVYFLYRKGII